MRVAYLDVAVGISGDMFLGALVDAGVEPSELKKSLTGVLVEGWDLVAEKTSRCSLQATKVTDT